MTNRTLVDLLGEECRRTEARAQVLFALGVALRKLDEAERDSIHHADTAIAESRQTLAGTSAPAPRKAVPQ